MRVDDAVEIAIEKMLVAFDDLQADAVVTVSAAMAADGINREAAADALMARHVERTRPAVEAALRLLISKHRFRVEQAPQRPP
jgi:hypothetical protein